MVHLPGSSHLRYLQQLPSSEGALRDEGATEALIRATDGSPADNERLFLLVYGELRQMAQRELRRERSDHTLQPTELVHEVFFRIVDQTRCRFDDRKHFMGLACRAMRQVLVDHARRRNRGKRAGGWKPVSLENLDLAVRDNDTTIMALNEVLERLMARHPEKARIVEMHFFAGFKLEECAEILGTSLRTVSRNWAFAQAWLAREMTRT